MTERFRVHVGRDGTVTVLDPASNVGCSEGRRPAGLLPSRRGRAACGDSALVAAYFAEAARLEAASIVAFRQIARELHMHGAPRRLVKGAERAAREEIGHARAMSRLARRFGARVDAPRVAPTPLRSLEQLARDNEIEGCVRETYGALSAAYRGLAALDPNVAQTSRRVAAEEASHALFSWRLSAWARSRLDRGARGRLDAAREEAIAELAADIARPVPDAVVRGTGHPSSEQARRLFAGLRPIWGIERV